MQSKFKPPPPVFAEESSVDENLSSQSTKTLLPSSEKLERLQWHDYGSWILVAALLIALLYLLAPVLMPFIAAALVAYMVEPLVHWLDDYRIGRVFSAILVLLATFLIGLGLMSLLFPLIFEEILPLLRRLPELPQALQKRLNYFFPLVAWQDYINVAYLKKLLIAQQDTLTQLLQQLQVGLLKGGSNILTIFSNVLLFPVALFYFILAWPKFSSHVRHLFPPKFRIRVFQVLTEIDQVLAEYLHGQMLVITALAIYYSLTLMLVDLPHGFSLGVLTGLLVLVPYLGFVLGLFLALFVAMITGDNTLMGWVIGIFSLGQLLESYLLTPYLVGERIGLHPLMVIFVLLAFAQLLGFVGILLALPVSAILLVLLRQLRALYYQSRFYRLS